MKGMVMKNATTTKKGSKGMATKNEKAAKAASKKIDQKVGSELTRKYKDRDHVVKVLKDGFQYEGETFRSLTAIAKKVTGAASINGRKFFGAGN
jgi:hypothetical protein